MTTETVMNFTILRPNGPLQRLGEAFSSTATKATLLRRALAGFGGTYVSTLGIRPPETSRWDAFRLRFVRKRYAWDEYEGRVSWICYKRLGEKVYVLAEGNCPKEQFNLRKFRVTG